ncbi:MAG: transcription-repair coupling factor [Clostridia bacterium]|nr:transcription-repair coupling factor [Clostridia bacterium]MCI9413197.1 transcription-repair coupling factor [Clostridia bacterium]
MIQELVKSKKFQEITEAIKKKTSPIALSGLVDVEKAHTVLVLHQELQKPICLVTYNEIQAKKLCEDMKKFGQQAWYFPKREIAAYDYVAQSKDLPYERIAVLNQMILAKQEKRPMIVVTTIEAVMQNMISKQELYQNMVEFTVSKPYSLEKLKSTLVELGYERNELVENKGQFSIRGGILDVGLSENIGVRIEFWGDEVDSIRYFKISSQRSTEMIKNITIFPAHELLVKDIKQAVGEIKGKYPEEKEDIELIEQGSYTSKIDKYFNQFYERQENFLDYLSEEYLLVLDENSKINQRQENIILENNHLIDSLIEKERFVPEAIQNMSNFEYNLKQKQILYLEQNDILKNMTKIHFATREIHFHSLELEMLLSDLKIYQKEKKKIILLAGNELSSKKVCDILKEHEMNYHYEANLEQDIKQGEILVTLGGLSSGFENTDIGLVVISMEGSFEVQPKRKKLTNNFKQAEKIVFADLKQGDFVVHQTHGIGQFVGVNTITADNITKDYIKIQYRNDDMLYVPTSNLDTVRKYIGGGESSSPKLNKLGGKEWSATTSKVKKHLEEIAKDLVELYAKRQKVKGYAYTPDTPWQRQFEDSFPYAETEDQLRCIEEVKKDMEKDTPMDRLLCGDVGYGKTEVAIRAAFKAVMDQKQVAYLVPTTILANQQYEEFKTRMGEFAMKVELLNRFRSKKEQNEVVKKLKLGEIDVVVGTHRLLSQDVVFKDLGLLIIDEEHRFGVKDKERIKQLKNNVDVLTMTATPIPRTLHMSIVGVRDMSVIYEPPQNRKPVQTYVLEYDKEVVQEAITKELERDGQIFYLYNQVEGIEKKAAEISHLIPEANVGFAHGQMSGKELEEIMESFIKKEINVLVCTTILESGIDIPNANTIIVENADRLGLAQLYQIRGRVGRGEKQAYSYIMYRRDKLLSEVADKRLKAIKEFTEFGSGFKIAMRDLEIRGAGSMLGEMQHGHMEQVGYDTYCKLLDEVIKNMQGIEVREEQDVQIDLSVSSYIPDSFIDNSSQKIEIYQNIALCRTEEDIQNVVDEVIDRYGKLPVELENLLEIARIKELARKVGAIKISQRPESIVFYFEREAMSVEKMEKLYEQYGIAIRFSKGIEPYVTFKVGERTEKEIISKVKEFLLLCV